MEPTYTDRILQGEDGVYRWKCTLTREQALVHYRSMLVIGALVCTGLCAVWVILLAFGSSRLMTAGNVLPFCLILYGSILGLPALIGYLTLGCDVRSYDMDGEEIRHKHATKGGDAHIVFRRVDWVLITQNVFRIKQGITTYTVYVPAEDKAFARAYVRERVGSEKCFG